MDKLKEWLSAFRLRTLPLSLSGIIIGACFAYYNGKFNALILFLAMLLAIGLQILSNLANDYGDGIKGTDNDDRVGPMRSVQSGAISAQEMFEAIKINILIIIALTVCLLLAAFGSKYIIYTLVFFMLAALSVYAALKYTIGDSAYGYKGGGDIFVFIFFGFVSVMGSYFLFTKQIDHHVFLPSIAVGLLSVGVLNLNNMRDIDTDRKANKRTLAVKLGRQNARRYHLALIGSAMIVAVVFSILYFSSFFNLLFYIAFIPLSYHIHKISKAKTADDFDSQLKVLSLSTFLFAMLLAIGYIL